MNQLKNVVAVSRVLASELGQVISNGDGTCTVSGNVAWEALDIRVPAKLTINNKVENKSVTWAAQLVFYVCDFIQLQGHCVYRVTLADGTVLLMGTEERPYTITTYTVTYPENMGDSQLMEVKVEYRSASKLLIIG
ncbi:MAG: hypothetical protein K5683_02870 [Prevotella sp.]|nr:hypothetical protein [Prevotella sp.]